MAKNNFKATRKAKSESQFKTSPTKAIENGVFFSFKYLDSRHEKFSFNNKSCEYFCTVISRFKDISSLTITELINNNSKSLRCHGIDWEKTSEKNGFTCLNEQLSSYPPYQFSLSSNEHGRVHGFVINNIFYIVWLDPEHQLYR